MKFSEFVILERPGEAVDPLGFRRPGGILQDTLFPQFTVLTTHPGYLSALCGLVHCLPTTSAIDKRPFPLRFRELEILWGMANVEAGASVININRYQALRAEELRLPEISRRHTLFQRVAYGTLGHYGSAAVHWGLLDADRRSLTPIGLELASAFLARRRSRSLSDALGAWREGAAFTPGELADLGKTFGISAAPGLQERKVWKGIVDAWCARHPKLTQLWRSPVDESRLESALQSAGAYQALLNLLPSMFPALRAELLAIRRFERLAAAARFLFERRVAVLEFSERFADVLPPDADSFAASTVVLAKQYVAAPGFQDSRRLFVAMSSSAPDFRSLSRCVIEHHMQHQQAKGTSPYVDHGRLLVARRVDAEAVGDALTDYCDGDGPEQRLDALQLRFRRQWHFDKCAALCTWSKSDALVAA